LSDDEWFPDDKWFPDERKRVDLHRLLGLLRQSWLVLVLTAAVGAGLGVVHTALTPASYTSSSSVLFALDTRGSLSVLAEGSTYTQDLVPSYVRVMTTSLVLQPVIDQLGLPLDRKSLAKKISIEHELNSVIVEVSVSDHDPVRAAEIANAVTAQTKVAVSILSPKGTNSLGQIIVTTISPAVVATAPTSPVPLVDVAVGLLLGLILGMGVIVLWSLVMSAPINSRSAVERATTRPVIGLISLDPKSQFRPLPVDSQPLLRRSESFRFLQANLSALAKDSKICLVATSPRAGDGRTSTATNLAIAMALSHPTLRVLLVDAHLQRPTMAELLGATSAPGVTSVVIGTTELEDAIVQWSTRQPVARTISLLPAGPPVSAASDLLASEAMATLLKRVRELYDVVIIDSAPLLDATDGAILAAQTDGALLIVNAQKTRQRLFSESLARMELAGANVLGVVLNRATDASREYREPRSARHDLTSQLVPVRAPTDSDDSIFAADDVPTADVPTADLPAPDATTGTDLPDGAKPIPPEQASPETRPNIKVQMSKQKRFVPEDPADR
jgi:succinoglycan biosynthesis transport protein ExoP